MSMKKMKKNIRTLAALLIASATLAACSSDDNEIQNAQPANPTEPKTYTMTIEATKGDAAATRGLYYGDADPVTGLKPLHVKWNEGEMVEVVQTSGTTSKSLGTLKAKASTDGITTLTGELVGLQTGAQLKFYLHGASYDYTGQKGVLLKSQGANSIEEKYDYAFAATNNYTIDGTNVTVPSGINLEAQQSIVKFTFVDSNGNAINAKSLEIETTNPLVEKMNNIDGTGNSLVKSMTITPASATNVIYAAIPNTEPNKDSPNDYTLTVTDGNGKLYTYTKNVTFTNGKYYEVKVKMSKRCTLAKSTVGMIVGTDGLAYYVEDKDNLPTDVTAAGMVAYKNGSNGLVIALTDVGDNTCWASQTAGVASSHEPKVKVYSLKQSSEEEVKYYSWKVASSEEWKQIFDANGGNKEYYTGLNTAIGNAGGSTMQKHNYWTSYRDPSDGTYCYLSLLESGKVLYDWCYSDEWHLFYVRACFSF